MLATHAIRCTRCLVLLEAPRIARFPRCNNCGEQLTCADAIATTAEDDLRALQEWLRALTIRFDQLVLDLRWTREHWEHIAAIEQTKQPWYAQIKSMAGELTWIALMVWVFWRSPYGLAIFATIRLIVMCWICYRRSISPVVDAAAEHQVRRRRVTDQGETP